MSRSDTKEYFECVRDGVQIADASTIAREALITFREYDADLREHVLNSIVSDSKPDPVSLDSRQVVMEWLMLRIKEVEGTLVSNEAAMQHRDYRLGILREFLAIEQAQIEQ